MSAASCATVSTGSITESNNGVTFRVIEREHGSSNEYSLTRGATIDRNSGIVVAFESPEAEALAEAQVDPMWKAATKWISDLEDVIQDGIEIDKGLNRDLSAAELEQWHEDLLAHDDAIYEAHLKAIDIATAVQPLAHGGEDDEEFDAWFRSLPGQSKLEKWAGYFGGLVKERRLATERDLNDKPEVQVLVAAFTGSAGKSSRIHVRNYDEIEGGNPYSAPRIGLDLTDRERARLDRELEQSKRAVKAIQQLENKVDGALDATEALGQKLGDTIKKLGEEVSKTLTELSAETADMKPLEAAQANLAKVASDLKELAAQFGGADQVKAKAAVTKLAELAEAGGEVAGSAQKTVVAARALLKLDLGKQVLGLLVGQSDIPKLAQDLLDEAEATAGHLDRAGELALELEGMAGDLRDVKLTGVAKSLAPAELQEAVTDWIGEVQPWLGIVNAISTRWTGKNPELKAAAKMVSSKDGVSLPRKLDDLRDGVVELGENVEVGDQVRVVVEVSDSKGNELDQYEYTFRITQLGLYREIHGEAILARGANGTTSAKRWSPNVAAMATWHYRYRRPETNWEGFVNWLNPGFGIHAATLNQDPDESVEFGLGVQVRLFDGLFFAGIGGNLNVTTDHAYYFVGTDLLKLLGELSD